MKPTFPPSKNGKSWVLRGADSKRRAALRVKISPSQWGQVERRVNESEALSNRVTMGSNRSSLFNREEIRLENHGKRLSFSKDEDIFAFPEDRNGIPEDRFSELDERISFPEIRFAVSDDTF